MTLQINGAQVYVKHIDNYFALLVDEDEREHKIPVKALKNALPAFRTQAPQRSKIK